MCWSAGRLGAWGGRHCPATFPNVGCARPWPGPGAHRYGILSTGKTMMSECFGGALPEIVTAGFAAAFIAAMSGANLGGRLGWTLLSDKFASLKEVDTPL